MNHSDMPIDEMMIQKLVDGELDHELRSKMLSGLSEDSTQWKKIALAFVEAQIVDESLPRLLEDDEFAPEPKHVVSSSMVGPRGQRQLFWLTGVAASLMLGFLFGFLTQEGSRSEFSGPVSQTTARTFQQQQREAEEHDEYLALSDALSRTVTPVPDGFRRAMRKAGYSIQDKQMITNVALPSGGEIELPIRRVNVTFVGLNSFQ